MVAPELDSVTEKSARLTVSATDVDVDVLLDVPVTTML
jgi:hypothetical protein